MSRCVLSFSEERISKDEAFFRSGLHHSPSGFFPPLCPASLCLAANLSCCFLAFPWAPQRSWLHLLYNQTSGSEGQQPSFFACCMGQLRRDITTLVGQWYQLPAQVALDLTTQGDLWFWYAPKAPRAQNLGKHFPLPDSKGIWVSKCWSLPPLLSDLQMFTKSGYWILHLSLLLSIPEVCLKR